MDIPESVSRGILEEVEAEIISEVASGTFLEVPPDFFPGAPLRILPELLLYLLIPFGNFVSCFGILLRKFFKNLWIFVESYPKTVLEGFLRESNGLRASNLN